MNNIKSHAQALAHGLIEGVVQVPEVVAWADAQVARQATPEEWLLALSGAASSTPKELLALLHAVPGQADRAKVVELVQGFLARANRAFTLFDATELPKGFHYPPTLLEFARAGGYPYMPEVAFLNASDAAARDILKYVRAVDAKLVPFAQFEDRFLSLSSDGSSVYIVDIVERKSALLGSFDEWLQHEVSRARGAQHVHA